jgi:dTDP-4-dehydrorhamnose reductase
LGTLEYKILITGSNGLLGQKIVKRCIKNKIPFLATSLGENRNSKCPSQNYSSLDICDPDQIRNLFENHQFTSVIHTAAITNVDYCELNKTECQKVNVDATNLLYEQAVKYNCHFQLLSTDFVFKGDKGNYSESDTKEPLSVYAKSKVDAEDLLLNSTYKNWSIVRTIIVYGTGESLSRSNLIVWALDSLPKGQEMKLVNDQFRAPTWADDLAYACVEIILRKKQGIYHISGPVTRSIDKIVLEVAEVLGVQNPKIETISSISLNQPAKRPPKTGFDLSKAKYELNYQPKDIRDAVIILIKELS